jgi:Tol biopolymer transport system component
MTSLEDELREGLRSKAQALRVPDRPALDRDGTEPHRHQGPRWLIAAACLALVMAGVVALALRPGGDTEPAPPVESVVPDRTEPAPPVTTIVPDIVTSTPGINGWVAAGAVQDVGGDIYLLRQGEDARRLEVPGSDTGDEACPAWSPDGTRLLFGRLTASSNSAALFDAELVIVPISPDGTAGAPTVIALDGFEALEGFEGHPCGIWAPDGRWVALGGGGEVWVVDTQTSEIRRLPDLRPSDLEWRPGTDQLAIAGDMGANRSAPTLSTPVSLYTVSTGELGQLGSVEAAHFTWSPDGSTLAYEGGEDVQRGLRLVDDDGANDRWLVADPGEANHGIGPVWSPMGDRIAFQRVISRERHEVVLVDVADGNETVIEPPQTDGPNGPVQWYPDTVAWSPDGTTLLYDGWNEGGGGGRGMITVPVDSPTGATVLNDTIEWGGDAYSHGWVSVQRWGRQPLVADSNQDGNGPLAAVPPTPTSDLGDTVSPDVPAEVTELLDGFLGARVAGNGARQYLSTPDQDIPLLYSTTLGAPYDRAEFERVPRVGWPYGFTAFKVRLFAEGTVVEQLVFTAGAGRGLEYQPDGFGTDIAPTTENGQPVAVPYELFGGEVTVQIAHPWIFSDRIPFGRLIPEGTGVKPTTDGGERNDWSKIFLMTDPAPVATDCPTSANPVDAEALAASLLSDPDLGASAPVAVRVGTVDALMMDVTVAPGQPLCVPVTEGGDLGTGDLGTLIFDQSATTLVSNGTARGVATGESMRLYLFNTPEGSSTRILAVAIVAPPSRFDTALKAATPIVDSVEFRAP